MPIPSFEEFLRQKVTEAATGGRPAQSQMSNAQLVAQGPGYGSQAARVASGPSLPMWQQTPTYNMLNAGGTQPVLDSEGDLTSIINGKKVANWNPDHFMRDKPGYGPPEGYAFMTMNTETGAGGPNTMDMVNALLQSKQSGTFTHSSTPTPTSSLASQYAVPTWAIGIDQHSRSKDRDMADAGYSDLSKTMGIDQDGNYVRFDFGKRIVFLAPGNRPEDFPQYEKLPAQTAGHDVYRLKTESRDTPNTMSYATQPLINKWNNTVEHRPAMEAKQGQQRLMELLASGANASAMGLTPLTPNEPTGRFFAADPATLLRGLFGSRDPVPTATGSLVPPYLAGYADFAQRQFNERQRQLDSMNPPTDAARTGWRR